MTAKFDVAVVGAGIAGLAHAWMAVRRRLRVLLVERSMAAEGASVRNFGMVWPIGLPDGEPYCLALRSRELWLELHSQGVLPVEQCGSIHLAHHADELDVLDEFCQRRTHHVCMLSAGEILQRTAHANPHGLLGGMFSPSELRVNPRVASAAIAGWLREFHRVTCCFRTAIVGIEGQELCASDGRRWKADRVIVCGGADLQTLYPQIVGHAGLVPCKLQMMRTAPNPVPAQPAPHLASGLTLRHYASFRDCASLPRLQARIASGSPELDRYGVHLMASQLPGGQVILGDSHEYGDEISPFDKTLIDELMLREARKVFQLSDWTIEQRWSGIYAKNPSAMVLDIQADDGTHIFTGVGGMGMTMSFGLAERAWKRWLGEN